MPEQKRPGESGIYLLSKEAVKDSERWFPNTAHSLVHHALGLNGEAGEVANIIKKLDRGDLSLRDAAVANKLMMEVTDVYTYTLCIAGLLSLDLDLSYQIVRGQNEKRFGGKNNVSHG